MVEQELTEDKIGINFAKQELAKGIQTILRPIALAAVFLVCPGDDIALITMYTIAPTISNDLYDSCPAIIPSSPEITYEETNGG